MTFNEIIPLVSFYFASFPVGLIAINITLRDSLRRLPFILVLAVSLIFGLAGYVIVLSILSPFLISRELFMLIAALSWSALAVVIKKKEIRFGNFDKTSNLLALAIMIFSMVYIGIYLSNTPWHAADDARFYGFTTSMLRHYGRNTLTHVPYSEIPSTMERGASVIAAYVAEMGGIDNGKAVLVAGALCAILMPILFYGIMFSLTRSSIISAIAALSLFNVWFTPYGMSFWSRYFTGNYGNVFGLLFLYLFVFLLSSLELRGDSDMKVFLGASVFLLTASYLVYIGYLLHIFVFCLVLLLVKVLREGNVARNCIKLILLMLVPAVLLCILIVWTNSFPKGIVDFFYPILGRFSSERFDMLPQSFNNPAYGLDLSFFGQNLESILLLPLVAISSIELVHKKHLRVLFPYFFVFLSLIVIFYSATELKTMLYFAPKRTALACNHLVWPVLLYWLFSYLESSKRYIGKIKYLMAQTPWHHIMRFVDRFRINSETMYNAGKFTLVALILMIILLPHITYSYATNNSWYVNAPYFEMNFEAALWLSKHATSTDLILNDMSYTGYILLSMGVFNLTYANPITFFPNYLQRAQELWQVWTNPYDMPLVARLLSKYNVKYMLSDADWKLWAIPGIDPELTEGWSPKPCDPSRIVEILDSYTFLEKSFEQGYARVYRVLRDKLNIEFFDYTISDDWQAGFWSSSCWGAGTIGLPILEPNLEIVKHGNNSLEVEMIDGNCHRASVSHMFGQVQDWGDDDYIIFYMHGSNTSQYVDFLIIDSVGRGQRWGIVNDFLGWREIILPLNPDFGWQDWDEPEFPLMSEIMKIEFRFTPESGDIYLFDYIKIRDIVSF